MAKELLNNSGLFAYVAIKASLHSESCAVFGLNDVEISALSKRYKSENEVINGTLFRAPPMTLVNALSLLGYKVVATTGEAEIVWTMQRDL